MNVIGAISPRKIQMLPARQSRNPLDGIERAHLKAAKSRSQGVAHFPFWPNRHFNARLIPLRLATISRTD
jgi:hypothetical protein